MYYILHVIYNNYIPCLNLMSGIINLYVTRLVCSVPKLLQKFRIGIGEIVPYNIKIIFYIWMLVDRMTNTLVVDKFNINSEIHI